MYAARKIYTHLRRLRYSFYSWVFINRSLALFLVVLYVITFCIVLPGMCNNLPYSKFYSPLWSYDEMKNRATQLNNRRLNYADQFLGMIDKTKTKKYFQSLLENKDKIDIATGVVSVNRDQKSMRLGYLTQTVTHLMEHYRSDESYPNKILFICDVHAGPGKHGEAISLSKYVPHFQRFPNGNSSFVIMDHFEREKQDYVYCLKRALEYEPNYVLIMEDDTLPRKDFFQILENLLENYVQRKPRTESTGIVHHWAYVKLYYPERWQGYGFDLPKLMEIVGVALTGGSVFLMCLLGLNRRRFRNVTKMVFFLGGAIYCVMCALLIGRQYFLEWRRISQSFFRISPAPACCSPAIIYPYDKALQLVSYLSKLKCSPTFPLDAALDKFVADNNYLAHLVEPNLVKHIGMYSSMKSEPRHIEEFI